MLQWMGGSRRKVTTSRKSIHKRQKQYFEQRRRQQQRAGLESYFDGKRACTLHCDYSRSLDILSLQNLSTLAQEHNTSTTTASDNLENADFSPKDQDALPSQVIFTSDGVSVDQAENNEWAPSNGTEAEYPKKVSVHLQNGNGNLAGNFSELDSFKLSMSHQIRVIDLLGDDSTSNAEENSLQQEGHVAFSVEGLGQVETETPVHSPKIPGRSFLDCYSPPKKAVRVPITSKNLDYGFHGLGSRLDVLMQDIDFSPCSSTIDQSFCTRDMINAAGDPKQNFLNFRTPSPDNWNCSNMPGILENDELVYNKRDSSRRIWEGPSFLDDGFDDLEEQESFCTNFDGRGVGFDDYYLPKSTWKQDLDFEGWDVNKKRSSIRSPQTYNVKASVSNNIRCPKSLWKQDLDVEGWDINKKRSSIRSPQTYNVKASVSNNIRCPKSLWKQDLDVEGWDINKKRSGIKRPETYNVKESPGPYPEHLTMKDLYGIQISDKRWHSDIEIGNDVKDNNSVTDDSRSRSLASEESCSCTAERGASINKS